MKLSIIIPVYNSSEILDELNQKIIKVMEKIKLINNFELFLINDYSKDNSWEKIKKMSKKFPFIRGLNLKKNYGQHNALMAGMNHCNGDYIITMDDDLQHPPEFIPDILKKLELCDVCYTNYRNRKHIGWKKLVSKLNNLVSSFLLNKPLKIYMSSFRGLRKEIITNIIKFKKPDVYIDGLIINETKRIEMITVDHHSRKSGQSNYTFKKLLILWSNMMLNYSFLPIRISSIFGIFLKLLIILFRKKNTDNQFEILEKT